MKPTAEQKRQLEKAGFKIIFIDEDEHEDGIGACAGWNAVKDVVWYTIRQALAEVADVV